MSVDEDSIKDAIHVAEIAVAEGDFDTADNALKQALGAVRKMKAGGEA